MRKPLLILLLAFSISRSICFSEADFSAKIETPRPCEREITQKVLATGSVYWHVFISEDGFTLYFGRWVKSNGSQHSNLSFSVHSLYAYELQAIIGKAVDWSNKARANQAPDLSKEIRVLDDEDWIFVWSPSEGGSLQTGDCSLKEADLGCIKELLGETLSLSRERLKLVKDAEAFKKSLN